MAPAAGGGGLAVRSPAGRGLLDRVWRTVREERTVSVSVSEANLVDVPAVVRLLTAETERRRGGTPTEAHQSALRLLLAHYALEAGMVWTAHGRGGVPLGVAVCRPPGARPDRGAHQGLLLRELGHLPAPGAQEALDRAALRSAVPRVEEVWLLVLTLAEDDGGPSPVLGPLLEAALRSAAAAPVVTVVASPAERDRLAPFGFRPLHDQVLPSGARAWTVVREPEQS